MANELIELKVFLVRQGLTQENLAEGCGKSVVTISGLINGKVGPRKDTIDAVLEFCRKYDPSVTYEQLFGADAEPIAAAGGER